jgi:hypothetical protein
MRLRLALEALPDDHPSQAMRPLLRRKLSPEILQDALAKVPPETDVAGAQEDCREQTQDRNPVQRTDPVSDALAEVESLAGKRIAGPRALDEAGERAALALGAREAWKVARRSHGPAWAALALAYMARQGGTVRDPARYLHGLVRRASRGRFDLMRALATTGRDRLTAVNSGCLAQQVHLR